MSEMPDHVRKAMESADTPDMIKRMIRELYRIMGIIGKLSPTDTNFVIAMNQYERDAKAGKNVQAEFCSTFSGNIFMDRRSVQCRW